MALVSCPECAKEISDRAPACPSCGFPLNPVASGRAVFESRDPEHSHTPPPGPVRATVALKESKPSPAQDEPATPIHVAKADYGLALMAIPLAGILLTWFWVGEMALIQGPSQNLGLVMLLTVLGTAIIASMEASSNGMVSDKKAGTYSPTQWFFIISLMWFIGYPAYLIKRRHVGLKRLGLAAAMLTTITVGSFIIVSAYIEEQKAELLQALEPLERFQREFRN